MRTEDIVITLYTGDESTTQTVTVSPDVETYESIIEYIPEKQYYTFGGWYLTEDFSGSAVKSTDTINIEENHILYAKFTGDKVNFMFNVKPLYSNTSYPCMNMTQPGLTPHPDYPKAVFTYTEGEIYGVLPSEPHVGNQALQFNTDYGGLSSDLREFYQFDGWYRDIEFKYRVSESDVLHIIDDGKPITGGMMGSNGNYIDIFMLTGRWVGKPVKLYFHSNGRPDSVLSYTSIDGQYDQPFLNYLPEIVDTPSIFLGWSIGKNNTFISDDQMIDTVDDIHLYAHWETCKIKLVKSQYDQIVVGEYDAPKKGEIVIYDILSTLYKKGYNIDDLKILKGDASIVNWVPFDGGSSKINTGMDNTIVICPVYTLASIDININPNEGNYDGPLELNNVKYGSTVKLQVPTLEGYTFSHWEDSSGKRYEPIFTCPDKDLNLTAVYELKKTKVIFSLGGIGTVNPMSKIVEYSQEYGELPTPTSTNYTFEGWYDTPECDGTEIGNSSVLDIDLDIQRLYAKWSLNQGADENALNSTLTMNYALLMLTKEEAADPAKTGWEYAHENPDRWVQLNSLLKEQIVDPDWSRDTLAIVYNSQVYDIYKDYIDCDSGTRVFILKPSIRASDIIDE